MHSIRFPEEAGCSEYWAPIGRSSHSWQITPQWPVAVINVDKSDIECWILKRNKTTCPSLLRCFHHFEITPSYQQESDCFDISCLLIYIAHNAPSDAVHCKFSDNRSENCENCLRHTVTNKNNTNSRPFYSQIVEVDVCGIIPLTCIRASFNLVVRANSSLQ